jgi:hypothetical protein
MQMIKRWTKKCQMKKYRINTDTVMFFDPILAAHSRVYGLFTRTVILTVSDATAASNTAQK